MAKIVIVLIGCKSGPYRIMNHTVNYGVECRPYLGPAIQLFYGMSDFRPYFSLSYPDRELDFGLLLAAAPGVNIKLGKKFRLENKFGACRKSDNSG